MAAVNINTATVDELTSLKGVGRAKAEAIVKYREQSGGFKSVDDLQAVKGIGPKLIEKNKADIALSGKTEAVAKAAKGEGKARAARKPKDADKSADANPTGKKGLFAKVANQVGGADKN